MMTALIDVFGSFFDNWVWLKRIGLTTYTKWQAKWVDYLSSVCTIAVITCHIIIKICKVWVTTTQQAGQQKKLFLPLLLANLRSEQLWFVQKIFDYPV